MTGTTAEQSVDNLYRWLDTLANALDLSHSFARASNLRRIHGVFHHLSTKEMAKFKEHIAHICQQWHFECLQNGYSTGFTVEVSGGDGSGKGGLLASAVPLGPFIS